MFARSKKTPNDLDAEIAALHAHIKDLDRADPTYPDDIDTLAKLYKMKESLKDPSSKFSKDALIAAAASVGSVALILVFEGVGRGIITSKSLGFAPKPKNKSN